MSLTDDTGCLPFTRKVTLFMHQRMAPIDRSVSICRSEAQSVCDIRHCCTKGDGS